jgi:hypothetical protein
VFTYTRPAYFPFHAEKRAELRGEEERKENEKSAAELKSKNKYHHHHRS